MPDLSSAIQDISSGLRELKELQKTSVPFSDRATKVFMSSDVAVELSEGSHDASVTDKTPTVFFADSADGIFVEMILSDHADAAYASVLEEFPDYHAVLSLRSPLEDIVSAVLSDWNNAQLVRLADELARQSQRVRASLAVGSS